MAQESSVDVAKSTVATTRVEPAAAAPPATPPFKFNVHAPEFVPISPPAASPMASPMSAPAGTSCSSPFVQVHPADRNFFSDHEPVFFVPDFTHAKFGHVTAASNSAQGKATGAVDVAQKIVKQVEYQFSDVNLVANEFLLKIMNKDTEGYVPLSVIASWKKFKSLGATNQMLVKALRTSTKLIVIEDGKKVRRRQPFTEKHKEELQSRMVIAENLPEDSSRNSLEKIFGVVGSTRIIRSGAIRKHGPDQDGESYSMSRHRTALSLDPPSSSPRAASQRKCPSLGPETGFPEVPRQPPQGPRMPDGARGFAIGRGRPPASPTSASRAVGCPAPVLV